jgi:phenylalanyl-tRNA synthetase alpha chain
MQVFPREQYLILTGLVNESQEICIQDLGASLGVDQALVAAGAQLLSDKQLVVIREIPLEEVVIKEAGRHSVKEGLPERRVLRALIREGRALTLQELPALTGLAAREVGSSLRFLQGKKWANKEGTALTIGPQGDAAQEGPGDDEALLEALAAREGGKALSEELEECGLPVRRGLELLKGRRDLIELRAKRRRMITLTDEGRRVAAGEIGEARQVSQLTPELIASGEWKEVAFKAYDIHLGVKALHGGKAHPMQRVISQTRHAFLEMGFEETASQTVESAFWNFDALFQPQDHPAREMQDTFYLENPGSLELPEDADLVDRVRRTHEDGWQTGSLGWQYEWQPERARAAVLRTHTTATTVRALAENPRGPRKIFSVGRVFRREAIDFKHLPVFYQVDGIIIDEAATFANLLGTLAAFYRKMGFTRFEFRPAFFPYTEPSVEVFIWVAEKKDWFEMGGAGIFRPEVTLPLGCHSPVLAWGLGLERLAMLRYDVLDMRSLYLTDLEWLKEVPLCR